MEIAIIETEEALRRLSDVWNFIHASSHEPSVFLTWDWVESWWNHYGSDYRLLMPVAMEAGRPVAIAPLLLRQGNYARLEFLGQNRAFGEYLGFIIPKGRELQMTPAFCDSIAILRKAGAWDKMLLGVMREDQPGFNLLQKGLAAQGIMTWLSPARISPVANFKDGWPAYLAEIDDALVRRVQYNLRRLNGIAPVRFETARSLAEAEAYFDIYTALSHVRWGTPLEHEFVAFHRSIIRKMYSLGQIMLARLLVGTETVAISYDYVFADRIWSYQGGWLRSYSKYEVGNVLKFHVLHHAAQLGLQCYDFLEGNEWYKRRWSNRTIRAFDIGSGDAGPAYIF